MFNVAGDVNLAAYFVHGQRVRSIRGGTASSEDGSIVLDDTQFHQCVKLGRYEADRSISFVPPDGAFELMKYRATHGVSLPFKVHAMVDEPSKARVDYTISLRSSFEPRLNASSIVLRIPTPLNTTTTKVHTSLGKAKYHPSENMIVWRYVVLIRGRSLTSPLATSVQCTQPDIH